MVGYEGTSYLGLYFGNGDGTFQSPIGINTSLTQNGPIAAADFNLDGNLDLVAMRAGDGDEIVMLGDGAGGFTFGTTIFYAWPGAVAAGDLNGDGLPDLVTGHDLSPGVLNVSLNTTPIQVALSISAPPDATAGEPFTVTVTAKSGNGAILTDFTGTIHFTSTDAGALLPSDATLAGGTGTFTVTLNTTGTWTITAADAAANLSATSSPVTVSGVTGEPPVVSGAHTPSPPVVAQFGLGLYRWTDGHGWKLLSTMAVQRFAASADGQFVIADFGHNGLWRWAWLRDGSS